MAADYYPDETEPADEPFATTVRLSRAEGEYVAFVAELWNAVDKAKGVKRKGRRKWGPGTVMARLVRVGLDGLAGQMGGWPQTAEQRAEFIRRAVANAKRK